MTSRGHDANRRRLRTIGMAKRNIPREQIAYSLGISKSTVDNYLRGIQKNPESGTHTDLHDSIHDALSTRHRAVDINVQEPDTNEHGRVYYEVLCRKMDAECDRLWANVDKMRSQRDNLSGDIEEELAKTTIAFNTFLHDQSDPTLDFLDQALIKLDKMQVDSAAINPPDENLDTPRSIVGLYLEKHYERLRNEIVLGAFLDMPLSKEDQEQAEALTRAAEILKNRILDRPDCNKIIGEPFEVKTTFGYGSYSLSSYDYDRKEDDLCVSFDRRYEVRLEVQMTVGEVIERIDGGGFVSVGDETILANELRAAFDDAGFEFSPDDDKSRYYRSVEYGKDGRASFVLSMNVPPMVAISRDVV